MAGIRLDGEFAERDVLSFRYIARWLLLLTGHFLFVAPIVSNAAEATREQIQAAYLYRFLEFVEWPAGSAAGSNTYSLCVVGDERLAHALEISVEGKSIEGRSITVHQLTRLHQARACHVVFLTGRRQTVLAQLAELQSEPILTASDVPGLEGGGNIVTFYFKDNRMQFEISAENAKRRGITISSHLLQLSRPPQ